MKELFISKMIKSRILFNCFFMLIEKHFLIQKKYLQKKFLFGPAHLRAINLIERNPGINPSELMFKLKKLPNKV